MNERHESFEELKMTDHQGAEYWSARRLAKLLEYSEYRHFLPVLARAKEACQNSGQEVETISRIRSEWFPLVLVLKGSYRM